VGIVNDPISSDDAHRPTGISVLDVTLIVYPIGKKFLPAAEYPISSSAMPNTECLIEPSFIFKDADKALQHTLRFIFVYHVGVRLFSHSSLLKKVNKTHLNVKGYLETQAKRIDPPRKR